MRRWSFHFILHELSKNGYPTYSSWSLPASVRFGNDSPVYFLASSFWYPKLDLITVHLTSAVDYDDRYAYRFGTQLLDQLQQSIRALEREPFQLPKINPLDFGPLSHAVTVKLSYKNFG